MLHPPLSLLLPLLPLGFFSFYKIYESDPSIIIDLGGHVYIYVCVCGNITPISKPSLLGLCVCACMWVGAKLASQSG